MAKLGDAFLLIRNGASIKQTEGASGLPITRIETIANKEVDRNKLGYANIIDPAKYQSYILQDNDILMSHINSEKHLGKVALYKKQEEEQIIHGMNLLVLRANPKIILPSYAAYFFETSVFFRQIQRITKKSVNQASFTVTALKDVEIPILTLEEQSHIVSVLDKVADLIAKRRQQLDKLDLLVKSRFVEMFGDLYTNPFGWEEVNISKVVKGKISNGFFSKRDDYTKDGNVSVLGVTYVVNRMYSQIEQLPKTNASEKDISKFEVGYGDMLFCRSSLVAEGIGKASIVPENAPKNILFECHVIRVPLNLELCVPEFLQVLTTTEYFRKQIVAQSKTSTMTTIGQDGILKANIVLPPIEEQRKFFGFVKQINKSKLAIQQSFNTLEILKKSLMQKLFGR